MVGLGPLVENYSIIGTRKHVRSMADLNKDLLYDLDEYLSQIRNKISPREKECLITEHGKVPVCDKDSTGADTHCFHAHFLVFPGIGNLTSSAEPNFKGKRTFDSLHEALSYANNLENYFLISPEPNSFTIFGGWKKEIRQFARVLVAQELKEDRGADWKEFPQYERASLMASNLRSYWE